MINNCRNTFYIISIALVLSIVIDIIKPKLMLSYHKYCNDRTNNKYNNVSAKTSTSAKNSNLAVEQSNKNFLMLDENSNLYASREDIDAIIERLDAIERTVKPNGKLQFKDNNGSYHEYSSKDIKKRLDYAKDYNDSKSGYIRDGDTIYIYNFDKRKYLNHDANGGQIFTGAGKYAHEMLRIER